MTRSHATSTTSSAAGSRAEQQPAVSTHDHNYLGNVNSSRAPRRILSRHQRNADELDTSLDVLENSRLLSAIANHRRPTSTTNSTSNSTSNVVTRRLRGRASQANSHDEDHDEEAAASDEGTDGGSSSQSYADEDEEDSDSEDNQPLTSYVSPSNGRTRRKAKTSSSSAATQERPLRRTRRPPSNNSFVNDNDDDDDYVEPRSRRSNRSGNQRAGRNQKRPRYNEQSEEEEAAAGYSRRFEDRLQIVIYCTSRLRSPSSFSAVAFSFKLRPPSLTHSRRHICKLIHLFFTFLLPSVNMPSISIFKLTTPTHDHQKCKNKKKSYEK